MGHPGQQITLQEYINAEKENGERVDRLTEQIRQLIGSWRMEPVVKALQGDIGGFYRQSEKSPPTPL
jgi:hypothetical protein